MNGIIQSIRRTPYQSLASFLILLFTLFVSIFFFYLTSFFYGVLSYIETRPHVTVYFKTDTEEKDVLSLKDTIESSGKASEVIYVSKDEALSIYKELNKDNPLLLEMVSADILPASLEIYTKKPSHLEEVAGFLKKEPIVDEVEFQEDIVNQLLSLTSAIRKLVFVILGLLLVVSFVVIMTTTAFKIALKKEEIELTRFLGASSWYVRAPYLYEGMWFGCISATVATGVFYGIFFFLYPLMRGYLAGIKTLSLVSIEGYVFNVWPPNVFYIAVSYGVVVLFGVIIGFVGTLLSTSKYIK